MYEELDEHLGEEFNIREESKDSPRNLGIQLNLAKGDLFDLVIAGADPDMRTVAMIQKIQDDLISTTDSIPHLTDSESSSSSDDDERDSQVDDDYDVMPPLEPMEDDNNSFAGDGESELTCGCWGKLDGEKHLRFFMGINASSRPIG